MLEACLQFRQTEGNRTLRPFGSVLDVTLDLNAVRSIREWKGKLQTSSAHKYGDKNFIQIISKKK